MVTSNSKIVTCLYIMVLSAVIKLPWQLNHVEIKYTYFCNESFQVFVIRCFYSQFQNMILPTPLIYFVHLFHNKYISKVCTIYKLVQIDT